MEERAINRTHAISVVLAMAHDGYSVALFSGGAAIIIKTGIRLKKDAQKEVRGVAKRICEMPPTLSVPILRRIARDAGLTLDPAPSPAEGT